MSAEDLQACNWAINGSLRRFFPIFSSYAFKAAPKIAFKLEEEELEAVGIAFDMVAQRGEGWGMRV